MQVLLTMLFRRRQEFREFVGILALKRGWKRAADSCFGIIIKWFLLRLTGAFGDLSIQLAVARKDDAWTSLPCELWAARVRRRRKRSVPD
jgi:hypothetical protein